MSTYITAAERNFTAAHAAADEAGLSLSASRYRATFAGTWFEREDDLSWDDSGRAFFEDFEETICECSDCSDYGGTEECETYCAYCKGKDYTRSEERRVGKECRARWAPRHESKTKVRD